MYIAEIAPSESRGKFVSINQLTIVVGILLAQIANWQIAEPIVEGQDLLSSWNGQWGWRYMFWVGAIPSVLFFVLILIIPESPRWLASQYKYDKAASIFSKIWRFEFALEANRTIKSQESAASKKK